MNHIILIGNGFDLAHGLETSYMHFLNWYLKNIAISIEEKQYYEDDIIKIVYEQKQVLNSGFYSLLPSPVFQKNTLSNSPLTVLQILKEKKYTVAIKSYYFEELFEKIQINTWVDIEILYFSWLKRIYNSQFKSNNSKTYEVLRYSLDSLNKSFNELKNQLEIYLISLNTEQNLILNSEIKNHFSRIIKTLNSNTYDGICVINFNYTNTINKYFENYDNIPFINIHGDLNDTINPMIFGYGDETNEHYMDIENINDNNYLKFMKSFGYFKSNAYQDLIKYIDGGEYKLHIIGHSCGLSDRVLLKKIFEDNNCKKINIYYHQKDENENDFIDKCMNISRHFSSDKKDIMRGRITSKKDSLPLVSFKAK